MRKIQNLVKFWRNDLGSQISIYKLGSWKVEEICLRNKGNQS